MAESSRQQRSATIRKSTDPGRGKTRSTGRSKRAPEPSRRDDARARMYHQLVFESAECVFGRRGFDGAAMQDIASEAGISLKTLYATFPGKRELYDEIQKVRGNAFVEWVLAASALGADPLDRLDRWARAYVDFLLEHHPRHSEGRFPPTILTLPRLVRVRGQAHLSRHLEGGTLQHTKRCLRGRANSHS